MNIFEKDIETIFDNKISDSLIFYAYEYNLNIEEMKKIFINYANKYFEQLKKDLESESDKNV